MKAGSQSNYIFEVSVSPEQKQAAHDKVLKEYQQEAVQPGFRKGHVPLAMVEKMTNPNNLFVASLEELVNEAIQEIVDQHADKRWVGQIYALDTSKLNAPDQEGQVTFQLDVFPQVEEKNSDWKKQKVQAYSVDVTSEDITKTIDQLRSSYATFEDIDQVTTTSLMRLKTSFLSQDGSELGKGKSQYLGEEELAAHQMVHVQFIGKKKGDIIDLDYDQASLISLLQYKGEETPTLVRCEILDIKQKVLPELNQAFIDKTFGAEEDISSVEELTNKVKETLEANKTENALYERVDQYLTAIDSSFELAIPKTLIDEELKNRLDHLGKQLGGEKGMKAYLERMGEKEAEQYIDTIRQAATSSIHKYFILKYVADELQLNIDWEHTQANGEVEKKLYEKLIG